MEWPASTARSMDYGVCSYRRCGGDGHCCRRSRPPGGALCLLVRGSVHRCRVGVRGRWCGRDPCRSRAHVARHASHQCPDWWGDTGRRWRFMYASDEIGRLTGAFNEMVEGLRQRDFIRDTFGRYVSPEVVRTLLESADGLKFGGEKREITVLMSDLRGYTQFAEQGDPAWVMETLNDYLARMTDIIISYGGTINEFIGDAIFAVYGAPIAHADHAERAAASALAMQRAMAELNQANAARGRPRFEMGIGLNTGEAVVGNIGSEQRAKYAVVGAAVNLAARVEGCTVGGQIFLSPSAYAAIQTLAEVAPPVPVEVKGIAEPLLLHELRGITGRFAQHLSETDEALDQAVEVALPMRCWVIEGKVIGQEAIPGTVQRLGLRSLEVCLAQPLRPLTNVRLPLRYPESEHDSGDLYGKVLTTTSLNNTD
ncbi:MAG: adenylate/guanylate cyclase domain-containing protein, partial [Candidatus Tectomicrobia bacterium]|nr:adenylate/guanylate cyclase domain-containing protein [Candidatus Tectomicrobia bacterium]